MAERKNINAFAITLIVLLYITLTPISVSAQEEKSYTQKGSKGELKYSENQKKNRLIVSNVNYDDFKVRKELKILSLVDPSFPGYSMDIQNQFIAAFNKTFSKDKLEMLSKAGEKIVVNFDVDQDGKHLGMYFVLARGTMVTTDELLTLEENLKELVIFKPIRKPEGKFLSGSRIKTTFSEILNGDISILKKRLVDQQELEQTLNNLDESSK